MNRLCCRLLLMALSLSSFFVIVAGIVGHLQLTIITAPMPSSSLVVRIDRDGWLFQTGPVPADEAGFNVQKHPALGLPGWETALEDLSPTWLTSGIVYAHWNAAGNRYQILGIKHYVVIPLLGITTFAFAMWFRRRWPDNKDPE